ncbi:hypothetical protein [Neisseria uirgultaei]|uniref:hypothetical protein n=1 Tax=Neisseria uirgultaei TaxID=2830646 RepID=UPI00272CDBB4|nr:hypothetical protein [Neisseria uirgultaei]
MPSEKIYYGVLIFLCAVSMLLTPFFYAGALKSKKAALRKDGQWKLILLSNAVVAAVLAWVWWKWF